MSRIRSWGYQLPNGSFDGMVGAAERKIIDIGSSPALFRFDRLQKITYGRKTWHLQTAFMFLNRRSITSVDKFLRPLSASVWYTTLASFVVVAIFMKIAANTETILNRYRDSAEHSWSFIIVLIVGAFCQQGNENPTPEFQYT